MSKISLKPNASGTGVFSLEAPNSNVDRTLTLPDEAGSVLTNVSDIESQVKTATNATGSAPVYACRAWVNFDGTGTVSIRDSGNVSSITDNGQGDYTLNFATAMPDDDYSFCGMISNAQNNWTALIAGSDRGAVGVHQSHQAQPTNTSIRIETLFGARTNSEGGFFDFESISIAIFR